jgi:hypothetical protein
MTLPSVYVAWLSTLDDKRVFKSWIELDVHIQAIFNSSSDHPSWRCS